MEKEKINTVWNLLDLFLGGLKWWRILKDVVIKVIKLVEAADREKKEENEGNTPGSEKKTEAVEKILETAKALGIKVPDKPWFVGLLCLIIDTVIFILNLILGKDWLDNFEDVIPDSLLP